MAELSISRVRRTAVVMAAVLWGTFAAGCYTYVPSDASVLSPGKPVGIEINDLGRLNLSNQIGGDVSRVDGTLVSQTADGFTLRVSSLEYLNGRDAQWSGESVLVRKDFVRGVFQQKLSPGKTAFAVLAGAAGVGALLAARGLVGTGDAGTGKSGPAPVPTGSRGIQ